jgi:hypothetical protein
MMTPQAAVELICKEALECDGFIVELRAGNDPGRERVSQLLSAITIIFDSVRGETALDRKIAAALFGIAYGIETITATSTPSKSWWKEFLELERFQNLFRDTEYFRGSMGYARYVTPSSRTKLKRCQKLKSSQECLGNVL